MITKTILKTAWLILSAGESLCRLANGLEEIASQRSDIDAICANLVANEH